MTKIEWTDETWNPIVGCSKISAGCDECYAEKMANRLAHNPKAPHAYGHVINHDGKWTGLTKLVYTVLKKPYSWKKPKKIFICSMGDLFHESIPFDWIHKIMEVIMRCPQHTFQILTKRPERMKEYFSHFAANRFKNVWIGVTAENQEMADLRIPILLSIPCIVHFVSIEPMLGHVDLNLWFYSGYLEPPYNDIIDWVICGGETGPKARKLEGGWIDSLKCQCIKFGVPLFFKSWGSYYKKVDHSLIEGVEYKEFPENS